jgi:hypothetical protein
VTFGLCGDSRAGKALAGEPLAEPIIKRHLEISTEKRKPALEGGRKTQKPLTPTWSDYGIERERL